MAKGEIFTGLPKWAQGLIAVAVVGGIGFISYKIYKKFKSEKDLKGAKEELASTSDTISTLQKSGQKPSLDQYQLNAIANQLFTAMNGYGTDVNGVYKAFTNVKSDLDVLNLVKAYGVKKLSSGSYNPAPDLEGTLNQHLTEELNSKEMIALNNLLARKGIKYRF